MVAVTSTFVTWLVYGIIRILHSAHMSNASMREHWSFVVDHVSHPYKRFMRPLKLRFDNDFDSTRGRLLIKGHKVHSDRVHTSRNHTLLLT